MPFNENRRARRKVPVKVPGMAPGMAPVDRAPDPAAAALGRAIMWARALKWRDEWQAEMAARQAKVNGGVTEGRAPRSAKQNGDAQFAAAIARNAFGRFYWDAARTQAPRKKN